MRVKFGSEKQIRHNKISESEEWEKFFEKIFGSIKPNQWEEKFFNQALWECKIDKTKLTEISVRVMFGQADWRNKVDENKFWHPVRNIPRNNGQEAQPVFDGRQSFAQKHNQQHFTWEI